MVENLEASKLGQLFIVCQDYQIKRYKNIRHIFVYEKHTKFVLINLKDNPEKEFCLEENIKIDRKEVSCVDVSWLNFADYCKKRRILLNVQAP